MEISHDLANAQKELERRRRRELGIAKANKTEWRPEKQWYRADGFTFLKQIEVLWEYTYHPELGISGWRKTDQTREVESSQKKLERLFNELPPDKPRFQTSTVKQTEEEKERIRQAWQRHNEKHAAIGACELLIRLHKAAERQKRQLARGPRLPRTIKAYPTLLNASHKADQVPAMRVYLLARALDQAGRGVLELAEFRRLLTNKRSRWRVYGRRRLRQILDDGEGKLWTRAAGRLWLKSPDKIADALGCGLLQGLPVELPVKAALLGSIATVKAHFYASYESGRHDDKPISQIGLADITGVPERTQRDYNKLLKRTTRKNITITGLPYTTANMQQIADDKQRVVFRFVDWLGKQGGPKKASYIAYRIADTRSICHKQAAKGRQRKINRQIDLVNKPVRGNSRLTVDRTYHPKADAAAAAYNRNPNIDRYYPTGGGLVPNATRKSRLEGVRLWGVLLAS